MHQAMHYLPGALEKHQPSAGEPGLLTKRELTVAEYYAAGESYKQSARQLEVSPATIRNHIASIYRKLEINNKAQLIHRLIPLVEDSMLARQFAADTPAAPALKILDADRLDPVSRPSVAVLPFDNIGDPRRNYFCQGVTLGVHNNLTRFPDLFVSGRSSCLAVEHIADDPAEAGLNLGVQYLVRGAVRSDRDRARITVELVDSASGKVLWSEQFDRKLANILEVETELANMIAGNLSIRIDSAQYERRQKLSATQLTAYDWQLRGYRSLELGGPENLDRAVREFTEAIKQDPESAAGYAGLSMSHGYQCDQLLAPDYAKSLERHVQLAEQAIMLDESDSRAHYAMACAHLLKGQFELADQHALRAVELNPSEYHNLCNRGYTLMSLDNFDDGIDCFSESLRRNPLAPNSCLLALGLMEYIRDNYVQSAIAFSRMLPNYLQKRSSMAAAFGKMGYRSDARSAAQAFCRYAADRSEFPASEGDDWSGFWSRVYPHLGRQGFERVTDGLRQAGLPV